MKNQTLLCAIIIFSATSFLFSQEEKSVKKRILKDFTFQANNYFEKEGERTLSNNKLLAPKSVLLNEVSNLAVPGNSVLKNNNYLSLLVGFQLNNKNNTSFKDSPILRIGISGGSYSSHRSTFSLNTAARYDTLISSQTGHSFYQDTTYSSNNSVQYSAKQIKLIVSLNFSTNSEKRWSLFGGIGIAAGLSVSVKTDIYRTINRNIVLASGQTMYSPYLYNSNMSNGYFTGNEMKHETFKNKSNTIFSAFIPIGIDFKLAKTGDICKKIHLFYEFRPNVNCTIVPELRALYNVSFQHGIGIRYALNN